jgi:hypothetical protein
VATIAVYDSRDYIRILELTVEFWTLAVGKQASAIKFQFDSGAVGPKGSPRSK